MIYMKEKVVGRQGLEPRTKGIPTNRHKALYLIRIAIDGGSTLINQKYEP